MDIFAQAFIMLLCLFMAELTCKHMLLVPYDRDSEVYDLTGSIFLAFTSIVMFTLFYYLFIKVLSFYVFDFSSYLNYAYFILMGWITFACRFTYLFYKYHVRLVSKISKNYDEVEKVLSSIVAKV